VTEEQGVLFETLNLQEAKNIMDKLSFSGELIHEKLMMLDSGKTPGPDGLHPYLLKSCADYLAEPLAIIFQYSYDSGTVPGNWKSANVCPIFKKGSRNDAGNYRPFSLTSVPCKIMESIIKGAMTKFADKNKLVRSQQQGFVRGRSCLTNLLKSFESWTKALDEGYGLDIIYLDYRKAFDTVPHQKILLKLRGFEMPEEILNWIAAFLSGRKMRVNNNNNT